MSTSEENGVPMDEGIDPERIVNDEQNLAKEFFCDICQGLLWKAKACSSCQHLFCQKCIQIWLQFNPTSCPFRCSPYEEKRPAPYIHSLLSRLTIRCRNHSFGCQEILPYDSLEQHETVECEYLSQRCDICGTYVLLNHLEEHRVSCLPATVPCFVCKYLIDRPLLPEHLAECMRNRLNLFIDQIIPSPEELGLPGDHQLALPPAQVNANWLSQFTHRIERLLPGMPQVNLVGFDRIRQAREENVGRRIWTMLQLLWLNKSRALQLIVLLTFFGIGLLVGCAIALSLFVQNQMNRSIYRSIVWILIFNGLLSAALPYTLASLSDTVIMVFSLISLVICSSACSQLTINYLPIDHSPWILGIVYVMIMIGFKLFLVMVRLYSSCIPAYLSAGCVSWMIVFVTFHLRRFSINRL